MMDKLPTEPIEKGITMCYKVEYTVEDKVKGTTQITHGDQNYPTSTAQIPHQLIETRIQKIGEFVHNV